ncbi:MAG: hypothetical protein FJ218_06815 [Ignavibacteria bacterium]|nr:hypothetical protein [Ignavibacteria bacterium]
MIKINKQHVFFLNEKTLRLEKLSEGLNNFRIAIPGKDYSEEMIDTIIARSTSTFIDEIFSMKGLYLFGNRWGWWSVPDFFILGGDKTIFMIENKIEIPSQEKIDRFFDYCESLEYLSKTAIYRYEEKGGIHTKNFSELCGGDSELNEEISYFCAFLWREDYKTWKLHKKLGVPKGNDMRKTDPQNLEKWKNFLLERTAKKFNISRNLLERFALSIENKKDLKLDLYEALYKYLGRKIKTENELKALFQKLSFIPVLLVPNFSSNDFNIVLQSRNVKIAKDTQVVLFNFYKSKDEQNRYAISFSGPQKWDKIK